MIMQLTDLDTSFLTHLLPTQPFDLTDLQQTHATHTNDSDPQNSPDSH